MRYNGGSDRAMYGDKMSGNYQRDISRLSDDPVIRLRQMAPKNHKGRRQVKSRRPNSITLKRMWHDGAVADFVLDALEDGFLVGDGEGKTSRIVLKNPSRNEILNYIDTDVIGHHRQLKRDIKSLPGEFVSSEIAFFGMDGKKISPDKLRENFKKTSPRKEKEQTIEEFYLEKWEKEDKEKARTKKKSKKKINPAKLREKAMIALLDSGKAISGEAIEKEIKRIIDASK